MEFIMDFNKPSGCKKVEKFILDNLKTEAEKDILTNMLTGKNVLKTDVIDLFLTLIQAMNVTNEVNMEKFEEAKANLDRGTDEKTDPTPGPSGLQKAADKIISPENDRIVTPKTKFNKENVCYYYATNKCKFGKECRKEHPKICNKFKKHGLKKFNRTSGCSEDCEYYHPMACFESMKTKTCKRGDCKFYHITGTKKEENPTGSLIGQSQAHNTSGPNSGNCNFNAHSTNNSYNSQQNGTGSVFQETRQPWEIAIEKMANQMQMMMSLQQTFQTQIQPLLQPQRS